MGGHVEPWRKELAELCRQALGANTPAVASALESLAALGVSEADWGDFLGARVLSLRGWGGMVRQVEERADSVHHPIPTGSFAEFVAVRLLLDRAAFALFQAARVVGLSDATPALLREVEAFPGVERRRLFHRAFERRLRVRTLDALAYRAAHPPGDARPPHAN